MSKEYFEDYFAEAESLFSKLTDLAELIDGICSQLSAAIRGGSTIFWMGNGGSASDAQHLAAELVGRFEINRAPIASIALTTDSSILTSVGNDFGFEEIFVRQIMALGKTGDVCIGITTSGRSQNVIKALKTAKGMGLLTIALAGPYTELLSPFADEIISVPSSRTCHIQEAHIAIGQALCGLIESSMGS